MSSNFQTIFLLFWHKIRCIVQNKKEELFVEKNANHTISIYGKCMTSIFFDCDDKNFSVFLKLPPKNLFFSTAN